MRKYLDHLSDMYYKGQPVISDAEFDVLSAHFNYLSVGHTVTDGVKHYDQMFSLKKVFDIDDAPLRIEECFATPKLDGAAVSLLYVGGIFTLGLTRGDGIVGKDITDKMKLLVPNQISLLGVVQVVGEVVAPKKIPNARNYAAGALGLKDINDVATRDVMFVTYGLSVGVNKYYTSDLVMLWKAGFSIVSEVDTDEYPTDGIVFRLDNNNAYKKAGYTSKHPRGAFALKEQKEGIETTLLDVIWQVGKSGVVSPVAILEPVLIGGATVAKATLHNIEYIKGLALEIGCTVEVIRSGEIIPRILRRTDL